MGPSARHVLVWRFGQSSLTFGRGAELFPHFAQDLSNSLDGQAGYFGCRWVWHPGVFVDQQEHTACGGCAIRKRTLHAKDLLLTEQCFLSARGDDRVEFAFDGCVVKDAPRRLSRMGK